MSDGKLIRVKLAFERDFTQIPNEWVRGGAGLSLRAIGLLTQLMSHQEGFTVTLNALAATNAEGQAAIRNAVDQLKQAGFLTIETQRGHHGKITGSLWILTDPAEKKSRSQPQLDFPRAVEPRADKPRAVNRTLKEAHSEEHLYPVNQADPSTRAGAEEDGLPADSSWVATESPADKYRRLIHAKCPLSRSGREHDWAPSGYCTNCGERQPTLIEPTVSV